MITCGSFMLTLASRICPESGKPMASQTPTEIIDRLMALPEGTRLMLLAPVVQHQKGEFRDVIEKLAREGFVRAAS